MASQQRDNLNKPGGFRKSKYLTMFPRSRQENNLTNHVTYYKNLFQPMEDMLSRMNHKDRQSGNEIKEKELRTFMSLIQEDEEFEKKIQDLFETYQSEEKNKLVAAQVPCGTQIVKQDERQVPLVNEVGREKGEVRQEDDGIRDGTPMIPIILHDPEDGLQDHQASLQTTVDKTSSKEKKRPANTRRSSPKELPTKYYSPSRALSPEKDSDKEAQFSDAESSPSSPGSPHTSTGTESEEHLPLASSTRKHSPYKRLKTQYSNNLMMRNLAPQHTLCKTSKNGANDQ
ncbi:hypothetical protein OS493_019951 [Desmophyllum pertusum]|uniref:Uncharacterized protein n=1 Tax=Desmophyllum pertusum TaxID=174260 RepID=A0A9W9YNA5_9CNID|nr:hypothetical protein OS493_019951 [Desmophyllum pertusum]